jgi:hypothetical protein
MLKVVSLCLWGKDKKYIAGALQNVKLGRVFYPGWAYVIQVHIGVDVMYVNELVRLGAKVTIREEDPRVRGIFWRMETAFNSLRPDMIVFRDCDSRPSERESLSVKEWEKSRLPVHIMRDHPKHTAPIMGGMWGLRPADALPDLKKLHAEWLALLKAGRGHGPYHGRKGYDYSDQNFLRAVIWPKVKDIAMVHDDVEGRPQGALRKPFARRRRPGEPFIGEVIKVT